MKERGKTHSVHKEGQNTEDTMPGKELVPKALQIHPNNPQTDTRNRTRGFPTKNNPHVIATSSLGIPDTTKNSSRDDEVESIARVSQEGEPSKTPTMSTSDIKPDTGHTHKDSYTGRKDVEPRTIHTKTRNSEQESTPQSTHKRSHRNIITNTPPGRNSKGTIQPDTLTRGPTPTPDEPQETIADNTTTAITETIAQGNSVPTHITVSSSENDLENDGSQLTAPIDHSTVLTPQQSNKSEALTSSRVTQDAKYTPQNIITIDEQDQNLHREINILENTNQGATSKEIRIHMQSPTTITITHRDLNNNDQDSTKAIPPTQQRTTNTSVSTLATRGRCNGTLYRLSPMGRPNNPMQQKSTCHIHSQNIAPTTTVSAWELTQTQDLQGIDNFHQDPDGKLAITT